MKVSTRFFAGGICLASLLYAICNGAFVNDEESIRSALFTNYSPKVRPYAKTDILAELIITSLNSLDIAAQTMSIVAVISLSWQDYRLAWNPASYSGVGSIVTAPEDIWVPPIVVENAMEDVGVIGGTNNDGVPLRITYTGQVSWFPPIEISVSCEMAISHYPFDTQSCTIILLGWTYPLSEMEITAQGINQITSYNQNGEFDLVDTKFYYRSLSPSPSSNLNETYEKIYFELRFRRKWQFYGQNLDCTIHTETWIGLNKNTVVVCFDFIGMVLRIFSGYSGFPSPLFANGHL